VLKLSKEGKDNQKEITVEESNEESGGKDGKRMVGGAVINQNFIFEQGYFWNIINNQNFKRNCHSKSKNLPFDFFSSIFYDLSSKS
jgi:hypothetical protein